MAVKSILLLLVLVVILAELPHSFSFRFTNHPHKPLVVYYHSNRTNVELRWDWILEGGDVLNLIKIERYRKDNVLTTETQLVKFYSGGNRIVETAKYKLEVEERRSGYLKFVIKDIENQGINEGKNEAGEKSPVDVMKENVVYVYMIEVDIKSAPKPKTDSVELVVYRTPSIKTYPRNQTASGGTVTFECTAEGKPTPIIRWEKVGSSQSFSQGSPLTITNFDASKVGVYRCTAKSIGIAENATATGYVQFSTCGSGCQKEELGIEFTDLTYNYEYETSSYNKYKELKNKIETECLMVYAKSGKAIRKCEVKNFRRGSVVAVIELGWSENTQSPKDPLLQAISDGNFAGYNVKTNFVSPTSAPTVEPPSTKETTAASPSGDVSGPGSGKRTNEEGGLSTGAVIALVVVFSIIFIVIIVVIIVCMLKRKKPSDTRKSHKEDARTYDKPTATVPLKSQPFDPMYDDPNEDRYPNGGGPPPQYTPTSNYAEVRPNEQDESQVEWDKSVKDEMWI